MKDLADSTFKGSFNHICNTSWSDGLDLLPWHQPGLLCLVSDWHSRKIVCRGTFRIYACGPVIDGQKHKPTCPHGLKDDCRYICMQTHSHRNLIIHSNTYHIVKGHTWCRCWLLICMFKNHQHTFCTFLFSHLHITYTQIPRCTHVRHWIDCIFWETSLPDRQLPGQTYPISFQHIIKIFYSS